MKEVMKLLEDECKNSIKASKRDSVGDKQQLITKTVAIEAEVYEDFISALTIVSKNPSEEEIRKAIEITMTDEAERMRRL